MNAAVTTGGLGIAVATNRSVKISNAGKFELYGTTYKNGFFGNGSPNYSSGIVRSAKGARDTAVMLNGSFLSKSLNGAGPGLTIVSSILDYQEYRLNQEKSWLGITAERYAYRTTVNGLSLVVGGIHPVAGSVIALGGYSAEKTYDGFIYTAQEFTRFEYNLNSWASSTSRGF